MADQILSKGTVTIDDESYTINPEFQGNAIQLADTLHLDEIESCRLLLDTDEDNTPSGSSPVASAVVRFQQRRNWLLDSLRILLNLSLDLDLPDPTRLTAREYVGLVLETKDGPARNGSLYLRKCLDSMSDIEKWLQALGDRILGARALGQTNYSDLDDITAFQQQSLRQQHESLGAIVTLLIRANYSAVEDFYKLIGQASKIDRWNNLTLHYLPVIAAFTSEYGSADGSGSLRDARTLDKKIMDSNGDTPWQLRNLHAATKTWWLAEYSGWYSEQPTGSPVQNVDFEAEATERSEAFFQALKDGALQCTLSICSQIVQYEWYDPSRSGLIQFLLRDSQLLPQDLGSTSAYFQTLIMEQFETFVDAFITNMPDTLRRFKAEEDSQRKKFLMNRHADGRTLPSDQDFHLERFLIIISFAFDNRVEAAQSFWSDTDSNLYGFLQWASKRQSTPTVGAFCEMLRSISKGEECAASAHEFLLEEGNFVTAKIRRNSSISWAQIFGELNVYVSKIREQAQPSRTTNAYNIVAPTDEIDEPESELMMINYLRLMAHLSAESSIVRSWMLSQQEINLLEVLFYLCNNTVSSRLQACALSVVKALLTSKTQEVSDTIWSMTDQWVSGALNPQNVPRLSKISSPTVWAEEVTFSTIAGDFEYMNEFCGLMHRLVEPTEQSSGLNDRLPFPESLGSAYRMPGIDLYTDFVLGKIFASSATQIESQLQRRVLNWHILSFVVTSLATFNEDLVILANRSTIPVDNAIGTSSLLAYVRLHPFARVMEWMFNERVAAALFSSASQSIEEVTNASPESPLVLGLIRAIEAMNLVFDLQSTYLDLVRPLVESESPNRRRPVMSPSLTSLEDSVIINLDLIVNLNLYVGAGHEELALSSLRLLEKLSSSRKLNTQSPPHGVQRTRGNRLIEALEQNNDLDQIVQSLCLSMEFTTRELEAAEESPGWNLKSAILDFLFRCLSASPEKPSLAHALLGFTCNGTSVNVLPDSLFANGASLFHAVVHIAQDYPDGDELGVRSWAIAQKVKSMEVLSILWSSPLTSAIVLSELRSAQFLFSLFLSQRPLNQDTDWDGRMVRDSEFLITDSALAFRQQMSYRRAAMQYAATECRLITAQGIPSLKARTTATLLGSTSFPDGTQLSNASVLDSFDFFDLDVFSGLPVPGLAFFAGLDFSGTAQENADHFGAYHNLTIVNEMIRLRSNELKRAGRLDDSSEMQRVELEAAEIISYYVSENHQYQIRSKKYQTLSAWSDLITLFIGTGEFDDMSKVALILQVFQVTATKFEQLTFANAPEATVMASMIQSLLLEVDFASPSINQSNTGGVANDRLYQNFRISLRAITSPGISVQLREILYTICYRYLAGTSIHLESSKQRRHGIHTVKHVGEKMMDIICDDAYTSNTSTRVAALLLLDSLAFLGIMDNSEYIVNSMVRTNFLQILVESIEDIPDELRGVSPKDVSALLSFYEWKFSLLLTIAQSKIGAAILVNAGLFPAVRASALFSVDPDIGIEINNTEALSKYYKLLMSITKVIVVVVLSRGPDNEQTTLLARSFLLENRSLIVAVFKREAKIGGVSFDDAGVSIKELVELFTALIAMTGFVEVGLSSSLDLKYRHTDVSS